MLSHDEKSDQVNACRIITRNRKPVRMNLPRINCGSSKVKPYFIHRVGKESNRRPCAATRHRSTIRKPTGYNPVQHKETALNSYLYTIVIENSVDDYYFTEKIVDAFLTGTILVYWGSPIVSQLFNADDIMSFRDVQDLGAVLEECTKANYYKRMAAVKENFELAKSFKSPETILEKFVLKDLPRCSPVNSTSSDRNADDFLETPLPYRAHIDVYIVQFLHEKVKTTYLLSVRAGNRPFRCPMEMPAVPYTGTKVVRVKVRQPAAGARSYKITGKYIALRRYSS